MAIKKSELYSSLWQSCDELRGGMDASQYKDYVLVLLFVKYVSDKNAGNPNALIEVPAGGSFADMVALKGNKEIGDGINKIISKLAEANDLKGVIDVADFNNPDRLGRGKEMVDRLSNLVGIFENPALDFSRNRVDDDDLLGDAYEYLMRHFATESGKSKGQFYTPAEVSRIMAKVIGIRHATRASQTLYDPTCGSGSLLLKAAEETPHRITIYGQEMDNATRALARMNMILHGHDTAVIHLGNTLASPEYTDGDGSLKRFDFVVANPPFSNKAWSNGINPAEDAYNRFATGIPPQKNGDYAFLLHVLASLNSTGKGAIILPHGVLFRGNVEADIRQKLIQQGVIQGIIGLPANLFYGTGIPACIIVLDKAGAKERTGIFMIDAGNGYVKDGNKNRLRHQDIHKIVDTFTRQEEIPRYARLVPYAEIEANEYNLNIPRYIDSTDPEDRQDIAAHLRGGIPQKDIDDLAPFWQVFPTLKESLFAPLRASYGQLVPPASEIKAHIFAHPEFVAYQAQVRDTFRAWWQAHHDTLTGIKKGDTHPKQLITTLAEDLLARFEPVPLVDKYDVYQLLMHYWTETMQDDVYLIVADGWTKAAQLRPIPSKSKEKAVLTVGKRKYGADLLHPELLVARYFATVQARIEALEAEQEATAQALTELVEEHGGEEGLLAEVQNERGTVTKSLLKARLKEMEGVPEEATEATLLHRYQQLLEREAQQKKEIKLATEALAKQVEARYKLLTEAEVQSLVMEDKWRGTLAGAVVAELERVSQRLTGRIQTLAERYATPLPQLRATVDDLSETVNQHLARMGFSWD